METTCGENPNPLSPNEDRPDPNSEIGNVNFEIDVGMRSLRTLIQDLRNTRENNRNKLGEYFI
jgi:hypothetical protein